MSTKLGGNNMSAGILVGIESEMEWEVFKIKEQNDMDGIRIQLRSSVRRDIEQLKQFANFNNLPFLRNKEGCTVGGFKVPVRQPIENIEENLQQLCMSL